MSRAPRPVGGTLSGATNPASKTDSALGALYWRLAVRVGNANAATVTARKLTIPFY